MFDTKSILVAGAVVGTALAIPSVAFANTACAGAPTLTTAGGGGFLPAGSYHVVPRPTDGVPAIFVPAAGAPAGGFYLPVAQLSALGIPFNLQPGGNPFQATCGAPIGATYMTIADSLDMNFDFDASGDTSVLGGSATQWSVANEDGQRAELKYARGFQLSEGSRTRLTITVPMNYVRVGSAKGGIAGAHGGLSAFSTGIAVGVSVPVSANWWLTPRVSYTMTQASDAIGGDGELVAATVSSNVRFAGFGRGELTMGNMVGYTQTVRIGLAGQDKADYFKQQNFWFRNGLAYQLPLKSRMFGRDTSVRASYTFTLGTKDQLSYRKIHEGAISFGLRMRETEQRTDADLLRVGLMYTHASNDILKKADYDSVSAFIGYRF